ncbi:hypothetical protein [Tychonema sp. BBK16]|uniref:hypothetical protein n=1 Tax=Tychonema sp. BBK16 TaxID=2699888 RepID=UPI0038D31F43
MNKEFEQQERSLCCGVNYFNIISASFDDFLSGISEYNTTVTLRNRDDRSSNDDRSRGNSQPGV